MSFYGEPRGRDTGAAAAGEAEFLVAAVRATSHTFLCDRWAGQRAKDKGRHSSRLGSIGASTCFYYCPCHSSLSEPHDLPRVMLDSYLQHASVGFHFLPLQYKA